MLVIINESIITDISKHFKPPWQSNKKLAEGSFNASGFLWESVKPQPLQQTNTETKTHSALTSVTDR